MIVRIFKKSNHIFFDSTRTWMWMQTGHGDMYSVVSIDFHMFDFHGYGPQISGLRMENLCEKTGNPCASVKNRTCVK